MLPVCRPVHLSVCLQPVSLSAPSDHIIVDHLESLTLTLWSTSDPQLVSPTQEMSSCYYIIISEDVKKTKEKKRAGFCTGHTYLFLRYWPCFYMTICFGNTIKASLERVHGKTKYLLLSFTSLCDKCLAISAHYLDHLCYRFSIVGN